MDVCRKNIVNIAIKKKPRDNLEDLLPYYSTQTSHNMIKENYRNI